MKKLDNIVIAIVMGLVSVVIAPFISVGYVISSVYESIRDRRLSALMGCVYGPLGYILFMAKITCLTCKTGNPIEAVHIVEKELESL